MNLQKNKFIIKKQFLKGLSLLANESLSGWTMAATLERLARLFHPRRDVAMANLAKVFPEADFHWKRHVLRRHYRHLAMSTVEFMALSRCPDKIRSWILHVDGKGHLDLLRHKNHGAIVLTGHIGNWELLSAWLCHMEVPLAAVVQRNQDAVFESFIDQTRRQSGLETLSKSFGMRGAVRVLRQGRVLGLLMDQNGGDLILPFFGHPARTSGGVAAFARLGEVPIVPVFTYREGFFRHRVEIHPPLQVPAGLDSQEFIRSVTDDCNQVLEKAILRCPEQWLWLHRRWR